jgi:hypothetical protein
VRASTLIALSTAVIAGCATTALPPPRTEGRSYPAYVFRGQFEHLEELVRAGRACGYTEDELNIGLETPHLTPIVTLESPARRDARFGCVMQWIGNHPETGFRP